MAGEVRQGSGGGGRHTVHTAHTHSSSMHIVKGVVQIFSSVTKSRGFLNLEKMLFFRGEVYSKKDSLQQDIL